MKNSRQTSEYNALALYVGAQRHLGEAREVRKWNTDTDILRVKYYSNLNAWYILITGKKKKVFSLSKETKKDLRGWVFFSNSAYIVEIIEQIPYQLSEMWNK